MNKFKSYEDTKAAYPIDSIIEINGESTQVTGYQYDGTYWFPINIAKNYNEAVESFYKRSKWHEKLVERFRTE